MCFNSSKAFICVNMLSKYVNTQAYKLSINCCHHCLTYNYSFTYVHVLVVHCFNNLIHMTSLLVLFSVN